MPARVPALSGKFTIRYALTRMKRRGAYLANDIPDGKITRVNDPLALELAVRPEACGPMGLGPSGLP